MKRLAQRNARSVAGALAALAAVAFTGSVIPASAATVEDWPAYLNGPMHSSYNAAETAIKPANVAGLTQQWHHAPRGYFLSSPTVADGAVFIASYTGWFYKLSQATGAVLDKVFIGHQPQKTCSALGVVDTATVAADPTDHQDTVYVGGADGYLYAFSASDLSLKWKSVVAIPSTKISDYFDWSSPTVANGKIYIGVASGCDRPLIRGAVIGYSQASGKKLAEFYTVPKGTVGGSVWSSVAVAGGEVYATTGNGPTSVPRLAYSESIIKLNPDTLKPLGSFQVPASQVTADGDFGGSPTIFGRYVGACNKNGIYYALNQSTMTLAWEKRIGGLNSQCVAAAVYNGTYLYFGGPGVTIGGKAYLGSVQERNPSDGRLRWETGLPNAVIGSPTMDGGGVLTAGTYDTSKTPNATYLVNAANGRIVRTLINGTDFAQSVFAGGWLFTANGTGVYAWGPGSTG
jgi:outer membrane protein assembly factor BamB